jgi:peptide/nickel transport system substrate-binding protein
MDPRRGELERLTRRTLLGAAGMGAAGLYLAACGGSSSKLPPTTTAAGTGGTSTAAVGLVPSDVPGPNAQGGRRGGRVVNVFDEEGNGYDPAIAYTSTGWEAICNLLYAPLYAYGEDFAPHPNAAATMPRVSADGTVYTIPLRPGVRFHNGREVVAADYKYAWERVLDPALESWASSYIYSIKGAAELYDKKATELAGVRVVDDRTLEVTLTQPDVSFLFSLTQPFMAPVPREDVERLGKQFATHPVGNGPFALSSYDSGGQKMTFKRFDGYFWPGLPYLDEVELRWGVDQNVQLLMLERGEVDLAGYGFNSRTAARIQASSKLEPYLYSQALFSSRWINLHPRVAAFKNTMVRQALNWGTDREQLQRLTVREADAWGAPFPKAMLGDARTFSPYTYDPERAKSLMQQSGIAKVEATLWVSDSPEPQIGQVLQQQWKPLGVDLKLKQTTADAINELSAKDRLDAWVSTYYAIYPTAIDVASQYWETGGSANYTHYSNPQVDAGMKAARAETDTAKRDALLARVEDVVGTDGAGVFIENVNWLMGRSPRLKNFHYSGVYGTYYDRLWLES